LNEDLKPVTAVIEE
jgi:hypothetical protein